MLTKGAENYLEHPVKEYRKTELSRQVALEQGRGLFTVKINISKYLLLTTRVCLIEVTTDIGLTVRV